MIKTTVKQLVAEKMGEGLEIREIAQRVGVHWIHIARHLVCTGDEKCTARHTPKQQAAIARAVDMSVGELFGDHAWFRIAARKLEERRRRLEMAIEPRKSA